MSYDLIVSGLTKRYGGKTAVEDFELRVKQGEILGLLGANGAGKSTTIECILGVRQMDRGSVEILGLNPVKQRRELFEQVGVQFQQTNYPERIKVKEACKVAQSLYRNPLEYEKLLPEFGLEELQDSMVNELSGGERQRLSVLLALLPNPRLVFLDELTSGLDAKARRDIWRYLAGLKKSGLTVIMTSHYMDEVQNLCDRVCILKQGKQVVTDTVDNVIANSPYTTLEEAYLWYSGEEDPNESL